MNRAIHAFNKDCDSLNEKEERLLSRMPSSAKKFVYAKFDESLQFPDDASVCIYVGHVGRTASFTVESDLGKRSGAVFVRCSRMGMDDTHRSINDIHLLYLRPSFCDVSREDWELILRELDPDVASRICADDVPFELARFFGRGGVIIISVLMILAQGYICVHADLEDAERITGFNEALSMMGWSRTNKVVNCGSGTIVEGKDFWEPSSCLLVSNDHSNVKREWEKLAGAKGDSPRYSWCHVEQLLDLLRRSGTPGDNVEVVVHAYLALATRVGEY